MRGLDLVAHGWVLPDTDPYSHTMPDWRWVEHAWLTDAVMALLYRGLEPFGALGLIVLFGVVTALAWWLAAGQAEVSWTCRLVRYGGQPLGGVTLSRRSHSTGQSSWCGSAFAGMESDSARPSAVDVGASAVLFALGQSARRLYGGTLSVRGHALRRSLAADLPRSFAHTCGEDRMSLS